MRVNGSPSANRLQEYMASRTVARDSTVEGVEYVRNSDRAGPVREASHERTGVHRAEEAEFQGLQALLDPEEEELIYELFPATGPDWGARAYRAAQSVPQARSERSGQKRIDLLA